MPLLVKRLFFLIAGEYFAKVKQPLGMGLICPWPLKPVVAKFLCLRRWIWGSPKLLPCVDLIQLYLTVSAKPSPITSAKFVRKEQSSNAAPAFAIFRKCAIPMLDRMLSFRARPTFLNAPCSAVAT